MAFSVLHVVSHVMDRDLGGQPARDIPCLVVLAVLGLVALIGAAATGDRPADHEERSQ